VGLSSRLNRFPPSGFERDAASLLFGFRGFDFLEGVKPNQEKKAYVVPSFKQRKKRGVLMRSQKGF
jgi:hypothetical protein